LLRTALEQTTHRLVLRRRMPPPFGTARFYVSSEGGLRYLRPRLDSVDPSLLRLASELIQPGSVVWDIGANLGLFTFAAAVAAGPSGYVLSIEPDISLVPLLRRSTALNRGHAPVDVLPVAVADSSGVGRFHIARRNRSTSHLDGFGTTQTGGIRTTEIVPTVTLDWLAGHFPLPHLIKIDVEAAETEVLAGGTIVLRSLPTIICEVAGLNSVKVAEILSNYGYNLFDASQRESKRSPLTIAPPNTLAQASAVPA
jgi:FkbM family methyltransferase